MTTTRYVNPPGETVWRLATEQATAFRWEYDDGRAALLQLYDKGKRQQWDAAARIDWSQSLHPDNPMQLPDDTITICGSAEWERLPEPRRAELRRHMQAWQVSQFLHGEQGALVCAARIVQQVEHLDAKFYAATQVMDEARHVEAFARLLDEKFALAYPVDAQLRALLEDVLRRREWDFTYLGMQVVIEGLALAVFQGIRDRARNPLAAQVNAYVMQDEARHVAFGRLALRDFYPQLSEAERDEREDFLAEACHLMRDRMMPADVWAAVGLDVASCRAFHDASLAQLKFRSRLFSRIVPTVKDIGLLGPRARRAFAAMGALHFAERDGAAMLEEDNRVAEAFDAERLMREARRGAADAAPQ